MTTSSRVVIISYNFLPDYAGWLQQTLTLIRACDPTRVLFTWVSSRAKGQPDTEMWEHISVRRIGPTQQGISRFARIAFGLEAIRYLIQNQSSYDVIYCPISYTPTDMITLTATLLNKPIIVRVAQGELATTYTGGRLRRWLFTKIATDLIVLNRQLYAELSKLAEDKLHWYPNGVDIERFKPANTTGRVAIRKQWNLPVDQKIILFVGSLVARKGVNTLVAAFAKIVETDPNCVLCLAGPDTASESRQGEVSTAFVEELRSVIRQSGLEQQILFLGRVTDVVALMRVADVYVLPSFAEGMPNVLLEAMAIGLPCVASDIPGVQELISDGKNGLLFKPGDEQMLAQKCSWLLNNQSERQRLGQAARCMIEQKFSIVETAQNYQNLFLNIVAR